MIEAAIEDRFTDSELVAILATLRRAIETVNQSGDRMEARNCLEEDERRIYRAMIALRLEPDDVKELDLES